MNSTKKTCDLTESQKKRIIDELKVSKCVKMLRKMYNNPNLPVVLRVKDNTLELEWQMTNSMIGHVYVTDLRFDDNLEIVWPLSSDSSPLSNDIITGLSNALGVGAYLDSELQIKRATDYMKAVKNM